MLEALPMVFLRDVCYHGGMYKLSVFAFVCLLPFFAFAKPKKFMVCLGQEEARLHKTKTAGPAYKLNQELISSLVQLRDSIYMKKEYMNEVCKANSPSIKTLELLMTKRDVFFSIYTESRSPRRLAIDQSTMKELRTQSALLFVTFASQIQAGLKESACLEKNFPQLKTFFEKMRYLLEDVGYQRILESIEKPEELFQKLQNLKNVKC